MEQSKTCPVCGKSFLFQKHGGSPQIYCSSLCSKRGWRKANHEKIKASAAAWYKANPEKHKASAAAWFKANPEKVIRQLAIGFFTRNKSLRKEDIPEEKLELKIEQLKLHRAVKQLKNLLKEKQK